MEKEKIAYYYELAKKYKEDIRNSYNETFEHTDTNFKINDQDTEEKLAIREIDSVILSSQNFLCNFIMSSVFSKIGAWAVVKIDKQLLEKTVGSKESAETIADEIDKVLEENSNAVYFANDTTNYYTETQKAVMDCIKVGTGIRKVIELKSNSKPFTYEYQNLDNIYILEDNLGKPNIIFKKYIGKNLQDINDLFGHLGVKAPKELTDENKLDEKINLTECVIGIFDENTARYKYYHALYTEEFEELLMEEEIEYNPYTVFRWQIDSSSPWGIGIGRANLGLFKTLKELKDKRSKHADKIVSPPLNFYGNIDLITKASLKAGAKNYGGSGIGGDKYGVEPINIGTQLIPLEQDIAETKSLIRSIYMAQPLGDVGDTRNRTATEMSLRHEMFRKEFSGTYELFNTELLEPTFMNAYYILEKKGLLNSIENHNYMSFTQIQYVNELTRNAGTDEVMRAIEFYNLVSGIIPEEQRGFIFKPEELISWASKKMSVPMQILSTKEEITQMIANQKQMEEIQALALAQENLGKRQDVGITEQIAQGVEEIGK